MVWVRACLCETSINHTDELRLLNQAKAPASVYMRDTISEMHVLELPICELENSE